MRRLMSFCNAPVGVAHAFQSLSLCLGFNTFTATVTGDGGVDSNQTLRASASSDRAIGLNAYAPQTAGWHFLWVQSSGTCWLVANSMRPRFARI